MLPQKRCIETWLVDFYHGPPVVNGKAQQPIETKEVNRAYAPTRWARNHVLTLKRRLQREDIGFSITR